MPKLLKIGQLATKAGVEKSTVQHYIRTGLLPEPVKKPHRNMAYYDGELVERIRLIKEMQTRYYLPLKRIKSILDDHEGVAEIRRFLASHAPVEPSPAQPDEAVARDALLEELALGPEDLERMEEHGFVHAQRRGDRVVYRPADVAILRAVDSMQRAGLNRENGFTIEDMKVYLDTTRDLIGQEVSLFTRAMGRLPRGQVLTMARAGLDGTSRLLIALRRKVFLHPGRGDREALQPAPVDAGVVERGLDRGPHQVERVLAPGLRERAHRPSHERDASVHR